MNSLVAAATAEIQRRWPKPPKVALVLGTGLGRLAGQVSAEAVIPYNEIPSFARTTAMAHRGQLVCGALAGVPVMLLNGRCHLYEGHTYAEVTLPIRVLAACGAATLIVTNASGGLNRHFLPGDVMIIEDHIDLLGIPLQRKLSPTPTPRPPRPAPTPYDLQLVERASAASRRHRFVVRRGVYAAVTGPNYETRAEYQLLRHIGADAVGMSTVPEVQVAQQLDMRVLGLSIVANLAQTDRPQRVDARQVVHAAQRAEPQVRQIVEDVIPSL